MLTPRERECLDWAANDKTMKETARTMSISINTVKHYRSEILGKLGCKTILGAYRKMCELTNQG